MNRTSIIALIVIVAAAAGYFVYNSQVGDMAETATENAAETASEAATDAVETATDAVESATDAVEGAVEGAVSEAVSLETLLTPEGFDAEKLGAAIDAAEGVDAGLKQILKNAVALAGQDPSIIPSTIEQVKAGLGL